MTRTVTLLLPTLNEIDGLKAVFPLVDRSLFDDILMVDGRSTDGSVEYALSQGIRVVTQLRKGLQNGVYDAVRAIDTDCVIEFSMDGNCLVDQLPEIVAKLKAGYDMVGVSRYMPPAVSEDDNWITAFGNWMFSKATRYLGSYPTTDALNMYRGYHRKLLDFPEFEPFLVGSVFEPLISAVANYRGVKMIEIPGSEPKRIGGESKMSVIFNGSAILWMLLRMYALKFGIIRVTRG